ncbi:MAG: hypothetical protein ABJA70_03055 [Chryseolinea sp.]
MARPFFALLSLSLLLVTAACTKRTICPAFQSAFIYDKNELRKKFSYFQEDSTPKVFTASKTKYLIAEPTTYRKKMRSLQTIEMKDIHPVLPDSMKLQVDGLVGEDGVVPGAELDLAARSVIDSTYIVDVPQDTTAAADGDSTYMISKDKELRLLKFVFPDSAVYDESTGKYVPKPPRYEVVDIRFNVEQDNYMWYLRNSLILPDVRLAQMMQGGDDGSKAAKKGKKGKKGISGFFKNLFKKKKKSVADSLSTEPAKPTEDFDYVDDNEGTTPAIDAKEQPKQKKSPFSFLKKKEKTPAATSGGVSSDKKEKKKKAKKEKKSKIKDEVKPDDPKKEEDDGF